MTTQQFIEKMRDGGCFDDHFMYHDGRIVEENIKDISRALLNPKAWQAVGKTEGWKEHFCRRHGNACKPVDFEDWRVKMHRMIDALCEGRNLEEFIATL